MMGIRSTRAGGFTLIELLVVLLIVALVSAVTLPVVLPALSHRQVSESARVLQAALEGARDSAIRANAPRGIRLLIDPSFPGTASIPMLAANRIVPIEPAGTYTEGRVTIYTDAHPNAATYPFPQPLPGPRPYPPGALRLEQAAFEDTTDASVRPLPNPPTSWFWNVRVGDKVQIGGDGRSYTVVGPLRLKNATDGNPDQFVNIGPSGAPAALNRFYGLGGNQFSTPVEFLYLVNGEDDDGDGWVDEGWDGLDNDGDGLVDEWDEWEQERWLGGEAGPQIPPAAFRTGTRNKPYTIVRRPYVSPNSRVVDLPSNVVIDLTTFNTTKERSRLPIDVNSLHVDILIAPNGSVIPTTTYSSPAAFPDPFYHFWLAERTDVFDPVVTAGVSNRLPMPQGTPNYSTAATARYLKGERRLVTLFARTGNVVTNEVELFNGSDLDQPYYEAQSGTREAK